MERAPRSRRPHLLTRDKAIFVISLLSGLVASALVSLKNPVYFWPTFLSYWLTQTLPLAGMLLLGARASLLTGAATGLLCFLVLCSLPIERPGGGMFYMLGIYGAAIAGLIASDSCRTSSAAIAFAGGFGAVVTGIAVPSLFLALVVYQPWSYI
jgi:hypothetical protein